MKIITAICEAFLVLLLFALFTLPFFIINELNAHYDGTSTVALNQK